VASTTTTKRFEFVGRGSDKFWEVTTRGTEVSVRFGRNGSKGQMTTKTSPMRRPRGNTRTN
jgi:predicted DNA-binding WGR domain protein